MRMRFRWFIIKQLVSLHFLVMAGLDPAIHLEQLLRRKTWMPGTSPGMTKLGRQMLRRAPPVLT